MAAQKTLQRKERTDKAQESSPEGRESGSFRIPVWLLILISAGIVLAIYSNTFHGPFIFDDIPNIRDNAHIRIAHLSPGPLSDAAFKSLCRNRPVANISFALNYYFHGYDLPGYHLVNILIHILSGIFLFFLVRDTLAIVRRQSSSFLASGSAEPAHVAFFAMLLWMVHPMNTQAVTYVVQRMDSMAAMFYLLSFVCYVQGRLRDGTPRWAFYAGGLVSGMLAFGTKEITTTLPAFIFLYEWFFFQDLSLRWIGKKLIWLAGIAAVFLVLAVFFVGSHPFAVITSGYGIRDFTMGQRVLTELRVVVYYLSQLAVPHPSRLSLEHEVALSNSLLNPVTTLFSLLFLVGMLIAAMITAKKERLVSFAILWYLGNLVIESSVIPLEILFEHRTYLPSMFLFVIFTAGVMRYARPRWAGPAVICIIAAAFSLWTYQRNSVWADEMSMLRDEVQKAPGWARTHTNLGLALVDRGNREEGIRELREALRLSPNRYALYRNLAEALLLNRQYQEALGLYSKCLPLISEKGDKAIYLVNIGNIYEKMGRYPEALEQYRQALAVDPGSDAAHIAMGQLHAKQGMPQDALREFSEALRLNPGSSEACNSMANVFVLQGRLDEAIHSYQQSLSLNTENPDAHYNLANVYQAQGRDAEAVEQFNEAIRVNPRYANARTSLALYYFTRGELDTALSNAREAVSTDPGNEGARKVLAAVTKRRADIQAALPRVEKSLESDPRNPQTLYQLGELYRMGGNLKGAIENYGKALAIRPDFPEALRQLAAAYSLSGDKDSSIAMLRKIVELHPDAPDAYYNISCQYSLQGNREEAVKWLSRSVDKGFHDWSLLQKDKDLYNIRSTEYYKGLVKNRQG